MGDSGITISDQDRIYVKKLLAEAIELLNQAIITPKDSIVDNALDKLYRLGQILTKDSQIIGYEELGLVIYQLSNMFEKQVDGYRQTRSSLLEIWQDQIKLFLPEIALDELDNLCRLVHEMGLKSPERVVDYFQGLGAFGNMLSHHSDEITRDIGKIFLQIFEIVNPLNKSYERQRKTLKGYWE